MKIYLKTHQVLLLYIFLAVLFRFFSFFPSVINHDESTYILIADAIRSGKIYFIDVVDTKPIGIFLLFGVFQELFGESIFIIRILTTLWIALTAFLLFKVQIKLGGEKYAPLAGGVIYIFITSIFTYYGISPNTEHFFSLFTIFSLWLLILEKKHWYIYLLAGLSLGIGFMIKYVVLFDAFAFALYLAWLAYRKQFSFVQLFVKYVLMGIGFCLPFGATFIYYSMLGYQDEFLFYTFEVSGRYFVDPHWTAYFEYLGDAFGRFFPVTIWFFYCLFSRKVMSANTKALLSIWSGVVLLFILLPGKFFGHYFIQFMLPFSLMAGSFFDQRRVFGKFWQKVLSPPVGFTLLGILFLFSSWFQWKDNYKEPDTPKEIAAYLKPLLQDEDVIYTGNYQPVVYHLLDKESPTKYIHRSLLLDENNLYALKIDHNKEMQTILRKKPKFIFTQEKYEKDNSILNDTLNLKYDLVKRFRREAKIYRRKEM